MDYDLSPALPTQLIMIPNTGLLSFVKGLCEANNPTDWVGVQGGNFFQGNTYQVHIDVDTKLRNVASAVAKISLARISNNGEAINAGWRISRPIIQPNTPSAGHVMVNLAVTVHDNDGYLEALALSVWAFGDQVGGCG